MKSESKNCIIQDGEFDMAKFEISNQIVKKIYSRGVLHFTHWEYSVYFSIEIKTLITWFYKKIYISL